MRFITSIFMMLTATTGVISAYFIGHWLVIRHEGHNWPLLVAGVLIAASVLIGFVYMQLAKRDPQPAVHGHGDAHSHTHADGTVHTHPHDPPGHTHV